MATGSLISIHEYLNTTYRPDCDYVDGVVVERNLGEFDHGRLQTAIASYFYQRRKEWGIAVSTEQCVQVSPTRFRIPDVCVIVGKPTEQIFRKPPFICFEILSKDDRLPAMRTRVQDFLDFGVPYVWIIDPATRKAWRCTPDGGMHEVSEFRTENPAILLPLADLFEE